MNWAINLTVAVIVTSLNGTFLFLVWLLIKPFFERKGLINYVYKLLRLVLILWVIPIPYFLLKYFNSKVWGDVLFKFTEGIGFFCNIFSLVYITGVLLLFVNYIIQLILLKHVNNKLFPVEDSIYNFYIKVCREMNINPDKIEVVYNFKYQVPYLSGLFNNYIVLPAFNYSEDQLRVIFVHELTHYKQRNYIFKYFSTVVCIFNFFNPLVWLSREKADLCGECTCDFSALRVIGDIKKYFSVIYSFQVGDFAGNSFCSQLTRSNRDLEHRIKLVKKRYRRNYKGYWGTAFLLVHTFVLGTLTVNAATEVVGNMYYEAFFDTADCVIEKNIKDDVIIANFDYINEFSFVEDSFLKIESQDKYLCNWNMPATRVNTSSVFWVRKGQLVRIGALVKPIRSNYKIGIINPDGTIVYSVSDVGSNFTYKFTSDGYYKFFVHNMSEKNIDILWSCDFDD